MFHDWKTSLVHQSCQLWYTGFSLHFFRYQEHIKMGIPRGDLFADEISLMSYLDETRRSSLQDPTTHGYNISLYMHETL